jgi:hypothetical protein
MTWTWPWQVRQAPTRTSDSSGTNPGACEKCGEYGMICLNGQVFLCWDHYVEAMKPFRERTHGQHE